MTSSQRKREREREQLQNVNTGSSGTYTAGQERQKNEKKRMMQVVWKLRPSRRRASRPAANRSGVDLRLRFLFHPLPLRPEWKRNLPCHCRTWWIIFFRCAITILSTWHRIDAALGGMESFLIDWFHHPSQFYRQTTTATRTTHVPARLTWIAYTKRISLTTSYRFRYCRRFYKVWFVERCVIWKMFPT